MAIWLVTTGYVLFATFVLRPWLRRRLEGRPIRRVPGPLALAIVVVSGVMASLVGRAVDSVIAGLLAYAIAGTVFATAFILRKASRSPG